MQILAKNSTKTSSKNSTKAPLVISPSWWSTFGLVFKMSVTCVWRRKASWIGLLVFSACVLLLFPFAIGTELLTKLEVRWASFWVVQEFVVALSLLRFFTAETEFGVMEFWLVSRCRRSAILMGKVLFGAVQLISLQIPLTIFWILFFNVHVSDFGLFWIDFIGINILFAFATSSLGVLIHCVTSRSLAKEILVPILFYPMQTSVLLGAVSLSVGNLGAFSSQAWWTILAMAPVMFSGLGFVLEGQLLQE